MSNVATMFRITTGRSKPVANRSAKALMLANLDWYREQGIELHIGDRACEIDRGQQQDIGDREVVAGEEFAALQRVIEEPQRLIHARAVALTPLQIAARQR